MLELLARPTLMVFGLISTVIVLDAVSWFLGLMIQVAFPAMWNGSGTTHIDGPATLLFSMFLLVSIMYGAVKGEYIASESTFYRVLRAVGEQNHRGRSRAPERRRPPTSHSATRAREVWSWDITYLAGPVRGLFYYLYLILDIYSRKIVGWEAFERECGEHAASVVERAVLAERCMNSPLVLHADNGSPMKGATLRATLERLGIEPSHSRPRVSNDNPFSEAAFRTCKYRPDFPAKGFAGLDAARQWVHGFVTWYDGEHRHSGIKFVTPDERHRGHDRDVLAKRETVYAVARSKHSERWSGGTRDWQPAGTVWLNPENLPAAEAEVVEA